jgi:hypothetical protein
MGNKYQRDLREIVGYDRTRKVLGSAERKENIGAKRGIGYFNSSQNGVGGVSGTAPSSGTTGTQLKDSQNEDGTLDPENGDEAVDQDAEQNGAVDPRAPHRSAYDSDQNTYDAKDLIDGENSPSRWTPWDAVSGIGQLGNYSNGFLKKLDGLTDCDTGKDLEVRFDDTFLPPDSWLETNGEPPADQQWELGQRWITVGAIGSPPEQRYGATPLALLEAIPGIVGFSYDTLTTEYDPTFAGGQGRWIGTYVRDPDPTLQYSVTFDGSCTVGGDEGCPSSTPTRWPEDDKMQLTFGGGKFKGSEYEPDADKVPRFTDNQHSHVDFCFDGGTRYGTIASTNEGGFMVYETSSPNGPPDADGIVRIFDSQGRITGYSDAAGITAYQPQ